MTVFFFKGFNRDGYDHQGYDIGGYNRYGFNVNGFDRYGYNVSGVDVNGNIDTTGRFDVGGFDIDCLSRKGEFPEIFSDWPLLCEFYKKCYKCLCLK